MNKKIILLKKLKNLGNLGDVVSVAKGYARNFLLPTGSAVLATQENIASFETKQAELEKLAIDEKEKAQKRIIGLTETLKLTAKSGDGGKLFGSISAQDIAVATTKEGIPITKNEIKMPKNHKTIRSLGEYEITIQVHPEVITVIQVIVDAE